ncbi:hypothetical protein ACBR40_45645 [Nonomuraea sp. AD125B]|uniref:hypothetical protein n=1 Tax=Nonomuraea sp. AD125B TaxID=3242897 RepID=UPI003526D4A7
MSIATPNRESSHHGDLDRVLAEIERRLVLDQAPPALPPAPLPEDPQPVDDRQSDLEPLLATQADVDTQGDDEEFDADDADDDIVDGEIVPDLPMVSGETRRVQRLRLEVAEAHELARLQADEAPLLIDTNKVRKRRLAVYEAARLHELAQDPVALAYRDAKVRRTTTVMVMAAATIGLAVSSIGVQASVATALKLERHTFTWWAAFGVEPALSLPLLAAVAVQAYSAMRGQVVDRKDKDGPGRKLLRAEALLLALTLILNCWPAFAPGVDFSPLTLVVHSLGPIAAVTAVWVLPALWSVLQVLPVPETSGTGRTGGRTAPQYRTNASRQYSAPPTPARVDVEALKRRARALIAAGELSADAGVGKFRDALGCGTTYASQVKKALAAETGGAA